MFSDENLKKIHERGMFGPQKENYKSNIVDLNIFKGNHLAKGFFGKYFLMAELKVLNCGA